MFTAQLAERCGHLLGIDASEQAMAQARRRCADLPQVVLQRLRLPDEFPAATFDLITFCKVSCCLNLPDLARAATLIAAALPVGGQLLLAHWTPPVHNYPLTGDEVLKFFMQGTGPAGPWRRLTGQRHSQYRLDVLEKK